MRRRQFALAAILTALAGPILAEAATAPRDGVAALKICRGLDDDGARLSCFDREATKLDEPAYQGRLSLITEPFEITGPTRLRFQSDGAIFVLYLQAADGTVLQNLHIGGGGEDSYRIETPGTYRLQINGSESWRIWLEPGEG